MADITSPRNLNPARRHRSYPRVVRRARHNSYRVKRPGDTGTRYHGPPTIRLVNLRPHRHDQLRLSGIGSRFGEADRMRRDRRERPRRGGRERDNETAEEDRTVQRRSRDRMNPADQRRADGMRTGARTAGASPGRRPCAIAGPRRRAAVPP